MKKLYLLLLVFLLLFIPATNAVTPYQLDHPIRELNNHTLREVFEGGNYLHNKTIINGSYYAGSGTVVSNNASQRYNEYFNVNINDYLYTNKNDILVNNYDDLLNHISRISLTTKKYQNTVANNIRISQFEKGLTYFDNTVVLVNMTSLGISFLTVEQMDMYYDYYLEAVQFEIDYYEAGLDPGEYQHIFKSILNGVKNLISEMGYVWQWLNAPIITTDMQDYSFNIDWSWDLIGVIRQIMNSAGILTLQIAFWVPSLAFAFMGIPVQVSVLSLLFSNLVFLLLGWILVKSLLI